LQNNSCHQFCFNSFLIAQIKEYKNCLKINTNVDRENEILIVDVLSFVL
jgi:hypothetical protein